MTLIETMVEERSDAPNQADDQSLLIVDDDRALRSRLVRSMQQAGFDVREAEGVSDAAAAIAESAPAYALVDLRLEDGYGLKVVEALTEARDDVRVVMLTGYGNIANAVTAIKAGAVDYLSKPASAEQIVAALRSGDDGALPPPPEDPMSADRVRWEHIQRVYEQCGRNVSETARRLKMHRRTLQRILNKHAPRP